MRIKLISGSYQENERRWMDGIISEAEWERFAFVWGWTSARFAGPEGEMQDRYFRKHGIASLYARINRVRKAAGFQEIAQ